MMHRFEWLMKDEKSFFCIFSDFLVSQVSPLWNVSGFPEAKYDIPCYTKWWTNDSLLNHSTIKLYVERGSRIIKYKERTRTPRSRAH